MPASRKAGRVAVIFVWMLGCLFAQGSTASEAPLPDPLTLQAALAAAEAKHPSVAGAQARVNRAQADLMDIESTGSVDLSLEGRARWVQPPDYARDQGRDDHKGSVVAHKLLYDSGHTPALEDAARSEVLSQSLRFANTIQQRRIRIMKAFLDVILADLEFARDNEQMAVVFVDLDKLRNRHELGQVSDIKLLKAESHYQRVRRERIESQNRQRLTRARLAQLLNVPDQLPANLVPPDLPDTKRSPPELQPVLDKILAQNPLLKALKADVSAAQERVVAAQASGGPRLDAEVEAAAYTRKLNSNDKWRAGVTLELPLYTGGAIDAAVAREQSELYRREALLRQAEFDLRQQVLELVMSLQALKVQNEEAWALRDYRELYLDRSRAVYEMEVKTDLGDAMVRLSEAELAQARTKFETALAWARLKALAGGADPVKEQANEGAR